MIIIREVVEKCYGLWLLIQKFVWSLLSLKFEPAKTDRTCGGCLQRFLSIFLVVVFITGTYVRTTEI